MEKDLTSDLLLLFQELRSVEGLHSAGIGNGPKFIIYFNKVNQEIKNIVPKEWAGVPVILEEIGFVTNHFK